MKISILILEAELKSSALVFKIKKVAIIFHKFVKAILHFTIGHGKIIVY